MHRRVCVRYAWLLLSTLIGCSFLQPRTDPTRYYVLTAISAKPARPPGEPQPARSVGIERIELPDYLTRPELVYRTDSNELKISEYERWGEPLKEGFSRTLHEDLALFLGTDHVFDPPLDPSNLDLILNLEMLRFERVTNDAAELHARFSLREGRSGKTVVSRETHKRKQITGRDTQATVAALSQLLGDLAKEVADAARSVPPPGAAVSDRGGALNVPR